ncbi:isoprenoid biosynthesis protein with amidotransferase-like domain [Desulfosarcina cetonica]|uniref:isoprenoid biosynthesis glyoxalase ElbB n=1 Tax=Desulfosarcina cetonica TaxID=90730 RepID=UPI0006D0DB53|nr:isoprenoid biosynthesis glyoxalase ElbB [Desulfosarcina cetonica]VTR65177.1 isoprenoid biosynthesis protein with amidotransferase-like domain [Desulfosarcina cetonica]
MTHRVGVLLSGCGVFDGSEIHEAVLTLLFLDRKGAKVQCMAPDMDQLHVVNHLTQTPSDEKRNVLVESARIARGDIKDVAAIRADDIDALIIPGGFGAAKNLSDFAVNGPEATVHPEVQRLLDELADQSKPIGAICIAPATLTRALGRRSPQVTIGNDIGTADAIQTMGGTHTVCSVDDICVDEKNRLVTTPAYMLGPGIKDVAVGIEKLVEKVLSLC